jgi:hypothetical protein
VIASGYWPTPTTIDATLKAKAKRETKGKHSLQRSHLANSGVLGEDDPIAAHAAVIRELWPTPTTQDAKNNGSPSQQRRNTRPLNARAGGPLNPEWIEWLMGFPIGWTALAPSGTPCSRRSRSGSAGASSSTKRG